MIEIKDQYNFNLKESPRIFKNAINENSNRLLYSYEIFMKL